jgi:hypothetical protein
MVAANHRDTDEIGRDDKSVIRGSLIGGSRLALSTRNKPSITSHIFLPDSCIHLTNPDAFHNFVRYTRARKTHLP